jgi:uncharacterized protein YbaP (TraB family)
LGALAVADDGGRLVLISLIYNNDDDEALAQLFGDRDRHSSEYREFQYRLVNQRNVSFAQKIETFLASPGTYFVLVGAAHLGGSDGVVRLLDARGHKGHRVFSGDRIDP